jgi:Berberine and berberine like
MLATGRALAQAIRPNATGTPFLNFTPEADRVRDAYSGGTYARLVALKHKYDPKNLFQLNQNIAPSHELKNTMVVAARKSGLRRSHQGRTTV